MVADVAGVRVAGHRLGGRHGQPAVLDRTHSFLLPTPPATHPACDQPATLASAFKPYNMGGLQTSCNRAGGKKGLYLFAVKKHEYAAGIAQRWARLFEVCRGCEKLDK